MSVTVTPDRYVEADDPWAKAAELAQILVSWVPAIDKIVDNQRETQRRIDALSNPKLAGIKPK